jgi:hypothetical protein
MNLFYNLILSTFCILIYFNSVLSVFFHIAEGEEKCFLEDVPADVLISAKYRLQLFDPNQKDFVESPLGLGVHVTVRDPEGQHLLSRVYSAEGHVTFTSTIAGEHQLCMRSNTSAGWFGRSSMFRLHLTLEMGEAGESGEKTKEKLGELDYRLRELLDKVQMISKEQDYQRSREERFRATSESTNRRVIFWAFTQTLLLVAIGLLQIRHLKNFFVAKKLV